MVVYEKIYLLAYINKECICLKKYCTIIFNTRENTLATYLSIDSQIVVVLMKKKLSDRSGGVTTHNIQYCAGIFQYT